MASPAPGVQYGSNPAVSYIGRPVGAPAGTNTTCIQGDANHPSCDAGDPQALNDTAATVANFRQGSAALIKPFWQYPDQEFLPKLSR